MFCCTFPLSVPDINLGRRFRAAWVACAPHGPARADDTPTVTTNPAHIVCIARIPPTPSRPITAPHRQPPAHSAGLHGALQPHTPAHYITPPAAGTARLTPPFTLRCGAGAAWADSGTCGASAAGTPMTTTREPESRSEGVSPPSPFNIATDRAVRSESRLSRSGSNS